MRDFYDYPLKRLNTFGIDVVARRFIEYGTKEELLAVIPLLSGKKYFHIGGGSNLLFTSDFDGIILHSAIKGVEIVEESNTDIVLKVGAGEVWDDFVSYCVKHGWYGIENLSLIPGEVGASAVQNIGAYGVEVKDVIKSVEIVDLSTSETLVMNNKECEYGYRKSVFKTRLKGRYAVTHVNFTLSKVFVPKLEYGALKLRFAVTEATPSAMRDVVINIRKEKLPDPEVLGNAGSFFMNPIISNDKLMELQKVYPDMPFYKLDDGVKIPAGWMIEQCGWKGGKKGRAGVYEKQALVLVNLGGATGDEVLSLCRDICESVRKKFGIDIHPEVNVVS